MVEIDREVVDACRKHLPEWHRGAFDDPRLEIRFLDARRYLEQCNEMFDVILLDVSDPVEGGPAFRLFTREFYEVVKKHLGQGGVAALQADMISLLDMSIYTAINATLKSVFKVVAPYCAFIPSVALPWGFSVATDEFDPRILNPQTVDSLLADRVKGDCRYYDGEVHQMSFLLPKHVRKLLHDERRLIKDDHPLFIKHD